MEINQGLFGVGLALTCARKVLATLLVAALVKDQFLMKQVRLVLGKWVGTIFFIHNKFGSFLFVYLCTFLLVEEYIHM